jgi:glutaconate CoA-transferase subunit A
VSSKLVTLRQAAALIKDGQAVTFSGSLLHRNPASFARELARQGRKNLEFLKASCAYDLDLLVAAGAVTRAQAGIVTFEAPFGMAPSFRRAVEKGDLAFKEHA